MYIERWYSGLSVSSEELAFDFALWEAAFSPAVRQGLVPQMSTDRSLSDLDQEDLSEENLRRFALASARKSMEPLRSAD